MLDTKPHYITTHFKFQSFGIVLGRMLVCCIVMTHLYHLQWCWSLQFLEWGFKLPSSPACCNCFVLFYFIFLAGRPRKPPMLRKLVCIYCEESESMSHILFCFCGETPQTPYAARADLYIQQRISECCCFLRGDPADPPRCAS